MNNICLDTDSYKASHWLQYPPHTTRVFSYIESRGGRHKETVFFGLQYILERYLAKPVTVEQVLEAEAFYKAHGLPFNTSGWMHIVEKHGGLLQLDIRAVPEGTVVPVSNVLVTVENTCDECFWCTSWIETMLLRVWYPITVCTESRYIKKIIKEYLDKTSDARDELLFKLHDFGSRGVSSQESAAIGAAAHLVNFRGTDTVVGPILIKNYYHLDMAGFSIPAAEHSTITSWGRDHEVDAYRNMIKQFAKPGSIVAVVSDSYDIYNACENIWPRLKDEIISSGATIVIRPDSGDPPTVVLKCLDILASKFGFVVNSKGYKVLNNVRIIQGDGIDADSIKEICDLIVENEYSITNVAFGMGGALLQKHHRDILQFAMKCSHIVADGHNIDVFKDPITSSAKKSKKGRLDLIKNSTGDFETVVIQDLPSDKTSLLTVFKNGFMTESWTFDSIRQRAEI